MKKILLTIVATLALSILTTGCGKQVIDSVDTEKKDDKYYYKSGELITGIIEEYLPLSRKQKYDGDNTKKVSKSYEVENGVLNGELTRYFSNGQIKKITTYKSGEKDGKIVQYYENGKMKFEAFRDNGNFVKSTKWDELGIKECTYLQKGDIRIKTAYYKNGEKKSEEHKGSDYNIVKTINWDEKGNLIK